MNARKRRRLLGALQSGILEITNSIVNVNVASFIGNGSDIRRLICGIDPVQDLHGYDNPWPAGGGKNKLPLILNDIKANNDPSAWRGNTRVFNGITFEVQTDAAGNVTGIKATGTASANSSLKLFVINNPTNDQVDYFAGKILNGCISGGGASTYYQSFQFYDGSATFKTFSDKGDGIQIASDLSAYYGVARIQVIAYVRNGYECPTDGLIFKPMLRLSTETDDTFAPYSNECPISGFTGLTVWRTGVNVWDEEWEVGNIDSTTGQNISGNLVRSKNYISVAPNEEYFINTHGYIIVVYRYDANKNFLGINNRTDATLTIPSDTRYIRFRTGAAYGTTYNHDISINYPSTDHDYHAYNGTTYPISWQSEAGTVYGGTLDVTNGKLTVTDGYIASYDGETLPYTWISDRDVYASGVNPTTGAEVVYKLSTPIEVQLAPTHIATLNGYNNIWTDAGKIILLEYVS